MERDFETNPYSRDEQRVADWLVEQTQGTLGGGDDPVGFLLASYQYLVGERNRLMEELESKSK